jgi:hypothetical protein
MNMEGIPLAIRVEIKPGVRLYNMSPQIGMGLLVLVPAWYEHFPRLPFVITDLWREPRPSGPKSLHPLGHAIDHRTRDVLEQHGQSTGKNLLLDFREDVQERFGDDPTTGTKRSEFDYVLEFGDEPHGHLEWDAR